MMILMKTADISNEVRPMEVASVWVECLFTEYFIQVDSPTFTPTLPSPTLLLWKYIFDVKDNNYCSWLYIILSDWFSY